jgi:hypothetical protein
MRRELYIAQPELSNEVLPPDSDFAPPPEPADGRGAGAGAACAGAGLAVTGAATTGAGEDVTGAATGASGVATATVVVLGAADARDGCETALVVGAILVRACAGRDKAAVSVEARGGELARRIGIAGPADAVETLDDSCSRGVLAGRSERPSTKKPANTATLSSVAATIMRT